MHRIILIVTIAFISLLSISYETQTKNNEAQLLLQALNYTENPIDIPNPDRGFYKGNSWNAQFGANLIGSTTVK